MVLERPLCFRHGSLDEFFVAFVLLLRDIRIPRALRLRGFVGPPLPSCELNNIFRCAVGMFCNLRSQCFLYMLIFILLRLARTVVHLFVCLASACLLFSRHRDSLDVTDWRQVHSLRAARVVQDNVVALTDIFCLTFIWPVIHRYFRHFQILSLRVDVAYLHWAARITRLLYVLIGFTC